MGVLAAYDGTKNLYTAETLPCTSSTFDVTLQDQEDVHCQQNYVERILGGVLTTHFFLMEWSLYTFFLGRVVTASKIMLYTYFSM